MSKRKGVSADEKKSRVLELFYEKKEFFQLKDLEKLAPKEKGVIANSVKDVVQSLVDDGLVDTDRIGPSTYYWSFPSKAVNDRKRKLEELTEAYESTSKKLQNSKKSLQSAKAGEDERIERDKYLDKITDLRLECDLVKMELKKYEENDPKIFEKMDKESEDLKNAANRWTDNIYNIKSWCKRKFAYEDSMLDKQFGIPDDFEYVE